jgi:hypothetical protein
MHFTGTALLLLCVAVAVYYRSFLLPLAGVLCAYGFAWFGHFVIEGNKPATFRYPLLSVVGDLKMFALILTARIGNDRSGIVETHHPSAFRS